ncbi:nuclease-related domain-containing protein [Gracilibacillus alcaliphilus]|uniref:nuclease-related domain-containing protein n=1 Tax=Gracilibacillus alcaliphilus TaxID=1401441 RepID=UPI0019563310
MVLKFDSYLEPGSDRFPIINDLLLKWQDSYFQIDTLLLTNDTIYLFELKNYTGQFYFDQDRFCNLQRNEIGNPIIQCNRTFSLFRRFLQSNKIYLKS